MCFRVSVLGFRGPELGFMSNCSEFPAWGFELGFMLIRAGPVIEGLVHDFCSDRTEYYYYCYYYYYYYRYYCYYCCYYCCYYYYYYYYYYSDFSITPQTLQA